MAPSGQPFSLDLQKELRAPEKSTETQGWSRVWPWETLARHCFGTLLTLLWGAQSYFWEVVLE
eukprot:3745997-Pyramimonas_sp.AAC.1